MANIIDMSLIQAATALTAPAFADVQEKVDQSFSLFMDVTLPMREENLQSNPLRQSLQSFASSGAAMLGTKAAGGIVDMFRAPATPPPVQSQRVFGGGMGGTMQQTSGIMQQTVGQDPAMAPWFSGLPGMSAETAQTGGW
tara:strand:- start:360 stop:779 length:420 start_codon:yes stop_codon:yes gene_type:complete